MHKLTVLFNPLAGPKILLRNRQLLWQLAQRNIASRYRGSLLGILWSFIQPLMMLCVYTFIFSVVLKAKWGLDTGDNQAAFAIIMFAGMAVFNIFSEGINNCCGVILQNPNYVKKVIFPLEILPVAQVVSALLIGLIWFGLLFLGALLLLGEAHWTALYLPVILIPLVLTTLGIGWFVASLGVYIRDIQYVVGVITQVLFLMSPVFYPLSAVPERYRVILQLNPLSILMEMTRRIFLFGQAPDWNALGVVFIVSCCIAQLGFAWFMKTKKGFADVI